MWSLINNLSQNKIKDNTGPPKLLHQNRIIYTNLLGVVNSNHKITPIEYTNPTEVVKIIRSLDNNTNTGLDGINTKFPKCVSSLVL